jgi:PAS domain S-box-containing protein
MERVSTLRSIKDLCYIIEDNGAIVEMGQHFTFMSGYSIDELLNKDIADLFKILRIGPNNDIDNIDRGVQYFLFTKSLEVRFINIEVINIIDKRVYVFTEHQKSRIEEKFNYFYQMCSANISGMSIYSIPDLILLKANQMYHDFFDAPYNNPKNTLGKPLYDFVAGFKDSALEELWREVIESGRSKFIKEFQYDEFARGTTYWDIMMTPIKEDGRFKYVVTNTIEVTQRVLYKRELEEKSRIIEQQKILIEEQKEELEVIISNMSDGLIFLDKHNKIKMLNNAAREFFYEPDNILINDDSFTNTTYYDKDGNELSLNDMPGTRTLRGEKIDQFFIKAKRPDKILYYSISGRPVYNSKDEIEYAVLCIHDITEKVKSEQEIKERKDQLEAILDNMQEGLVVFNRDGQYIIENKVIRDRDSVLNNKIDDIFKNFEVFDSNMNKVPMEDTPDYRIKRGDTVKDKILTYKSSNQELHLIVSGTPVFDEKGAFQYGIVSSRDITELARRERALKTAQAKLLQAEQEKNQALENAIGIKDEFLSIISHEFRTPLNVINTAIQTMNFICRDELSEKSKKYVDIIRQNTFRQLRLVNNLLDITRAAAGNIKINKKNIDIVFLTKSIVDSVYTYASQKQVMVTFLSSIQEKIIGIDDEKYERILLNLLSNAIKFTPSGKSIVVKLRNVKGKVSIEVKDDGIGIPVDKLDMIFERFGQVDSSLSRQTEGAGIGLPLVKKLVEAFGGSISVKSKLGKGSIFNILLPSDKAIGEQDENPRVDLMDNHLIHVTNVEFSDIYL